MQLTGISLNIMTLGGLAVAVGRVVDDAIVVLENIYRHRALGEDRWTAVLSGPREVASAITASTLTTVAVFLPLGFVGGLVSQFFLPFALTVTFALLASLVVRADGRPGPRLPPASTGSSSTSTRTASRAAPSGSASTPRPSRCVLRSRWTALGVVALAGVLFVASLALVPLLPTQFINAGSEKILQVSIAPPTGATSEAVLERAIEAETILLADPRRGARPDEHPRRGRHELPDHHRRPERSAGQQRHADRPPRPTRRPGRAKTAELSTPSSRSRPTATTSRSPRPPASPPTA